MQAFGTLPATLRSVQARPLFVMSLAVQPYLIVGATPGANRRVGIVPGGRFEGERLSGEVTGGGSDWQATRDDGATTLDVRLVLRTDDDALICMSYLGLRHGPAGVIAAIGRGESFDPASYYFRTNPLFETAAKKYDWINRLLAIGIGHRTPEGVTYSVFEIL
jgi:Protein of unknown function (DUF3237)